MGDAIDLRGTIGAAARRIYVTDSSRTNRAEGGDDGEKPIGASRRQRSTGLVEVREGSGGGAIDLWDEEKGAAGGEYGTSSTAAGIVRGMRGEDTPTGRNPNDGAVSHGGTGNGRRGSDGRGLADYPVVGRGEEPV